MVLGDGRRDGCRGRKKGEKIHSVLISGLRWGYIVLGAFYLDVATAGVPFSSVLFSFYRCHPHLSYVYLCMVCVSRINVCFLFLFV